MARSRFSSAYEATWIFMAAGLGYAAQAHPSPDESGTIALKVKPTTVPAAARTSAPASPYVRIFRLPVHLTFSLVSPYTGSAYRDLGGQPEAGADVMMRQDTPYP